MYLSNIKENPAQNHKEMTLVKRKNVTISDVATLAHTSIASVSYYLNNKTNKLGVATQERIAKAIHETNYIPNAQAQQLVGKQSHVISVILLNNTNLWAGQLLDGIEQIALAEGYQTVVCTSNFDQEKELMYIDKMIALGIDGFILQPTNNFKAVEKHIRQADKPVVFCDCSLLGSDNYWAKTNLYDGIYTATEILIQNGYNDFIGIGAKIGNSRTRMERHQGFCEAIQAYGKTSRFITVDYAVPTISYLREYFKQNINPAKHTLIFVENQWNLPRVFKSLKPLYQLIPNQIGLFGIDCNNWTDLTKPTITTLIEPVHELGEQICKTLINLLENKAPSNRQILLNCNINWQESTDYHKHSNNYA